MSDGPPPAFDPGTTSGHRQADVADPLAGAFADLRAWHAQAMAYEAGALAETDDAPDLATMAENYVALRQEITLQTRAVRSQQEQNAETLAKLSASLETLTRALARVEQPTGDEALRPVLKSLVETHDALVLADREIKRSGSAVEETLAALEPEPLDELPPPATVDDAPPRSFWGRWTLSPSAEEAIRSASEARRIAEEKLRAERHERIVRNDRTRETASRLKRVVSSLVTGYAMSLQRLERALARHGLTPLDAVGRAFDPETMEALDTVADTGKPAGEVVEEIRRGWVLRGKLFREAQVRVARS